VLELAGVPNASAKMMGRTNNKIANIKATFKALSSFKPEAVARQKSKKQKAVSGDQKKVTEEVDVEKVAKSVDKK